MIYSDVITILQLETDRKKKEKQSIQSPEQETQLYYSEKSAIETLKYLQRHGIENLGMLAEEMERFERLKKHEMQCLDKMGDPLEPLKISSALDSEIMKFEYRKDHDPESISTLDYTIIAALVEALEKRTGEDG